MKLPPTSPAFLVVMPLFVGVIYFVAAGLLSLYDVFGYDSDEKLPAWTATRILTWPVGEFGLSFLWSRMLNSLLIGIVVTAAVVTRRILQGRERRFATVALALVLASHVVSARADDAHASSVGIPARITDLVLPGSELEVLPSDAKTPVVLRITRVAPHGTEFRYDLEWTGLDAGPHDLRDYLRRKDGTEVSNLPEILVEVTSVLPPGIVQPNHPGEGRVPRFGGYRTWMIAAGVAWVIGLIAIAFLFRKKHVEDHAARARPKTLAERLRPLVESAMAGTLSSAERAQLELGLVAYWRRRLELETESPAQALAKLRQHDEAGPLLNQLDAWLYKPTSAERVDVAKLLAPYQHIPPDALEMGTA